MSRDMTDSEAIANLNHIYGVVSPDIQRSLDVAFKALEERPTVEITEKQAILLLINSGWLVNHDKELREKWERPQVELANEVWELYEKYQSHLATNVIEFGDELKDLLSKYQKGGEKE